MCIEDKLLQINELPKPGYMNKTLRELKIGTYEDIETAVEDTSIILALKKFVERRVSALPIVDGEGRLVDIYAKFDVIVRIHGVMGYKRLNKILSHYRIWQPKKPTMIWMLR